ncbi:hypothetical protein CBG04_09835 [Limosilactobacillus reuteri]|uniref:hypothetical protein n=1 Tax=Limosilactobacillus reuteri TaxID=1598 RepID=UPI000B98EFAF|nr:hypothetical protein [Limosilactobacillus reuteri]OYS80631.1 hypothetical protein CBG11_07355 [Limosilactobacillus reuteri]OYS81384.1 hypothetical protein CBG04_09835 [Limosilactobacillus reuteri]OYS83703.1 hypothetical protein CBG14_07185 [Limosilactobacillus reuteri]
MNKWWIFIDGIATAVYILLFWASLAGNVTYTTLKGKEYDLTMFPYIRWGLVIFSGVVIALFVLSVWRA